MRPRRMAPYPPQGGYGYPPRQFFYPAHPFGPPPPHMRMGPPRPGGPRPAMTPPSNGSGPSSNPTGPQLSSSTPRHYPSRPQPFDQYMCEKEFPRLLQGEDSLSQALLVRNQQITQTSNEQTSMSNLLTRVKNVLEVISASEAIPSVKIDEFREAGSFKKGTMMAKSNVADLVVIFKTLPTPETVKHLGEKIVELLKGNQSGEVFGVVPRDFGCEIAGTQAVLRLLVAVPAESLSKLDPKLHLKSDVLKRNLAALRHAYWFDEHAGQPAVKILVRLIKDIKKRAKGLAALDIWTIELMSHYCVTCTPDRSPLPLPHAFRRFFQLLSAGFLLHTSVAVADPCDQGRRINYGFSPEEADCICRTSQFILRLILHEKYDRLLAVKNPHKDVALENETEQNLNIAPLREAYVKDLTVNIPAIERFFSKVEN